MNRTMYPANDVELELELEVSESSLALASSAFDSENQDATLEAGAEDTEDAVELVAAEDAEDVVEADGENTLNIELDAEAGGLDFAKDAI